MSDIFYDIENSRAISTREKIDLERKREVAQNIIYASDRNRIFDSYVNEDIVRTLQEVQKGVDRLSNWIIVFDWKTGEFVTWEAVGRNVEEANRKYVSYERQFSSENGFEVVMIGSSDILTVRQTHSHYFGIQKIDNILESLDQSIVGFKSRLDIDVGSRQILLVLFRKRFWGKKYMSIDTLRNHFARNVITFDSSLQTLRDLDLISKGVAISLNIKKKAEIEAYL